MSLRVGAIGYATEQGLGHLLRDFHRAGIITDVLLFRHGKYPNHPEWYPPDTPMLTRRPFAANYPQVVKEFLDRIDVLLCFETPFDWTVFKACPAYGVKSVLMVMYEWTPRYWPEWPDVVLCPSLLDYDLMKGEFDEEHCLFLPVPVDPGRWGLRKTAGRFLHNAGHVGHREHKGTRELLRAIPLVKSPAAFTIRAQDRPVLDAILDAVPEVRRDARVTVQAGSLPYEQLFDGHDVYVAPEKLNGLSLPLQEARAAGLLVMTTDRYPTNTWLPRGPLIPVSRYEKACISRNYRDFDEAVVEPAAIAAAIDEWFDRDIQAYSLSGRTWAQEHSWEVLKPKYLEALEWICQ